LSAVSAVGGQAAADALAAKLNSDPPEIVIVDTPNQSGLHDATTIGVDMNQSTGMVGVVVLHELEHLTRAASQPGTTAGSTDPETSWGGIDDVTGAPSNPCGGMKHAEMGVESMQKLKDYACRIYVSAAERLAICKGWRKMTNKLAKAFNEAKQAGCPTPLTTFDFTKPVYDKPPCCPY